VQIPKPMFLELAHTKPDAFHVSKSFVLNCYQETKQFPTDEKSALVQQIRRAAVSVHLNLTEESSRKFLAERKRFYEISGSLLIEIDTVFDIAVELEYTTKEKLGQTGTLPVRTFQMLSKMNGQPNAE